MAGNEGLFRAIFDHRPAKSRPWPDGEAPNADSVREFFKKSGRARAAVLIGRDAARIAAVLAGVCAIEQCTTIEAAVSVAAELARPGDTVLLSPACASLDMFRDYAHRGDAFAAAVRSLSA